MLERDLIGIPEVIAETVGLFAQQDMVAAPRAARAASIPAGPPPATRTFFGSEADPPGVSSQTHGQAWG